MFWCAKFPFKIYSEAKSWIGSGIKFFSHICYLALLTFFSGSFVGYHHTISKFWEVNLELGLLQYDTSHIIDLIWSQEFESICYQNLLSFFPFSITDILWCVLCLVQAYNSWNLRSSFGEGLVAIWQIKNSHFRSILKPRVGLALASKFSLIFAIWHYGHTLVGLLLGTIIQYPQIWEVNLK